MTRSEDDGQSLDRLPTALKQGLVPVALFGCLSFISSVILFLLLSRQLILWRRKPRPVFNQFVFLIYNLVIADIQQSLAFLINARWLASNKIEVPSRSCWAQGWFLSIGDMASGAFCFAIGLHTFASVILHHQLKPTLFFTSIVLIWAFIYTAAITGIAMHPGDIYVRAGAWCWVNVKYENLRLYTHYLYIFTFELGTISIYALMYLFLLKRIRSGTYESQQARRARQAASLMVVYPIVYVVCTFPLAFLRTLSMTHYAVNYRAFCFAGAMITSNGWLDVLLYTCTRQILVFNDDVVEEGIDTFRVPFWGSAGDCRLGTTTFIEATGARAYKGGQEGANRHTQAFSTRGLGSAHGSLDELVDMHGIKTETTVRVASERMEVADMMALDDLSGKNQSTHGRSTSSGARSSYEFETKPEGLDR